MGILPVCVFGVVPWEDRLPVVREGVKCWPLYGVTRPGGGQGTQVIRGGVGAPPLFVPISLGVVGWGGCGIAPGFGWHGLLP